jgi:hypothetical protein
VDASGDVGRYTSIALDSNDYPHISYQEWRAHTTGDLKYARWTGSAWSIETVDSTVNVNKCTSLALDPEDKPLISYYDDTNENLKCASTPNEYFTTVNITPFDSDSDGQNDAVEVQMNADTSYSGTVPVRVHAFLVDTFQYHADYESPDWNIIGQSVDWQTINLYVPEGYMDGPSMYNVQLSLFDDDDFLEDFHHEIDIFLYPASESPSSDNTPPTVSILSPESGTYASNDVPLTFTVSESTSWIGYSLDEQENQTITGNSTLSELPGGLHSLIVYAEDASGNIGASEVVQFTVEAGEPEPLPEPFPTWAVVVMVVVVGAAVVVLVYFAKIRKPAGKGK